MSSSGDGKVFSKPNAEESHANSFRVLLKDFASNTSFGGISRATLSDGFVRRFLWALISTTCYGFTIFMSYNLVLIYLDKPISTAVDIVYEKNLDFPSVTVCNLNQFRRSKLKELPEIHDVLEAFKNKDKPNAEPTFEETYTKHAHSFKEAVATNSHVTVDEGDVSKDDIDSNYVMEQLVAVKAAAYAEETLMAVGHQKDDMIKKCSWMGVDCMGGYFSQFWIQSRNWKYGNCFTFNPGVNQTGHDSKILRTSKPGPRFGLSLDMNIEQMDYLDDLVDEAGIRIVIHNPRQMPFPLDDGITLPPGFSSSVAIRKETIQRVDPFRNGSCNPGEQISQNSIYRNDRKTLLKYSTKACMHSCLALEQQKICNCSASEFARLAKRTCNETAELVCMNMVVEEFREGRLDCVKKCPQPCVHESYRYSIMSSRLTTKAKEGKKEDLKKKPGEEKTDDDFNNNFIRVKVFYDELNLHRIKQSTSYTLENLLGDIGGQLGLWIGISVISVAEFGELLISLMIVAVRKSRDRNKTRVKVIQVR